MKDRLEKCRRELERINHLPPFTLGKAATDEAKEGEMKVRIILSNFGGELDRQTIEINSLHTQRESADAEISAAILDAIHCCPVAPGDTIKIEEVD